MELDKVGEILDNILDQAGPIVLSSSKNTYQITRIVCCCHIKNPHIHLEDSTKFFN